MSQPSTQPQGMLQPKSAVRDHARSTKPKSPFVDLRFWAVQAVVLCLAIGRLLVTLAAFHASVPPGPELTTLALFLIPVVYASLNFELGGGIFTAGWAAVMTLPRLAAFASEGVPVGVWADAMQAVVLVVLALLVAQRVAAERAARLAAEEARAAHLRAEERYRSLFATGAAPVMVVDAKGELAEANPAAELCFPHAAPLVGKRLMDVVGPQASLGVLGALLSPEDSTRMSPTLRLAAQEGSPPKVVRLATTVFTTPEGERVAQVLIEDVTEEASRQAQAEAYASQVLEAQEDERRRIARELHDGPVQSLIYLCRRIDAVSCSSQIPEAERVAIKELRAITESLVEELRSISRGLRPSVLDDLGLVAALERLVEEFHARTHIDAVPKVLGVPRRLGGNLEAVAYRIVQEALSNIERHARAGHVLVEVAFHEALLGLRIVDDGIGFDPRQGVRPGALGLSGMAERARLAGGRFAVDSTPGGGTTIRVELPVDEPGSLPDA